MLVYEYCVASGLGRSSSDPAHSLFREGRAMLDAVMADCTAIPGVIVETVRESDAESAERTLLATAARCDWAIVIAPEFADTLLQVVQQVRSTGCRLLGAEPSAIALTADKLALANHWREHGVPTPSTVSCGEHAVIDYPVVLKPRDGVGSEHLFLARSAMELEQQAKTWRTMGVNRPMLAQSLIPGQAASVAFLIGHGQILPLSPTFQHLSPDGRFRYLGGELPIPAPLAARAVTLGQRAIANIPGLAGYVGVDVVLGPAADGSQDAVIEINPRFTTSYVGLRAHADFNIIEMLLRLTQRESVSIPRWHSRQIRFYPDGTLEQSTTHKQFDGNR